jgi:hypothetical protein
MMLNNRHMVLNFYELSGGPDYVRITGECMERGGIKKRLTPRSVSA